VISIKKIALTIKENPMRKSALVLLLIYSCSSFASPQGDSYAKVGQAHCSKASGEFIQLNLQDQTLTGRLEMDSASSNLSNADIKQGNPDVRVELIRDWFESGFDVLGGVVTGENAFGTYVILLDRPLETASSQEMTILYVEAMTGRQVETKMSCEFR